MNDHLKLFTNHSAYSQVESSLDRPNVSFCRQENEVHYNPDPFNGHAYVDLGLPSGTLWATMNVGANSPTDYGLYFAWGETTGYTASQVGTDKQFTWSDYAFYDDLAEGLDSAMSKYNASDNKTHLELTDDAAATNMGGDWHMPNRAQCIELFKETKNGFVTNEGVFTQYAWSDSNGSSSPTETTATISNWDTAGYFFFKNSYTSVTDAISAEDYLFVPAAGECGDGEVSFVGDCVSVWASALDSGRVERAWGFYFDGRSADVDVRLRSVGQSVRGVVGEILELKSHTWYKYHLEIVLSKPATNVTLIYQRVQGPDPAPEEFTLTSSDGITWTTSELSSQYGYCADMTVVADGIAIGDWSERTGCFT